MASQIKTTNNELFDLYAITSFFSGGRLFVGAISVLYVLSHGITIGEFASIKSLQVITFLLFDIPAGLFIKRFGYKNSLIATFALSITGLSIYIVGNNLLHFLVAEFITALSLCLYPTAFTDYSMNFLKRHPNLLIEKIFHRSDMYASIATLVCGGIGGYLYNLDKVLPYYAGILLQFIGLLLVSKIAFFPSTSENKESPNTFTLLKRALRTSPTFELTLLIPIMLLFVIQLTIQPLYHYWQPLFYEVDKNVSGNLLGLIFASYTTCSIFLNFAFSKLSSKSFFRSMNCIFLMLLLATFFYFTSSISQTIAATFISFSILQGLLFATMTCISAVINRHIDDENRPITLKIISLLSRIGMLISFGCIQLLSEINVHNLYFLSACILGLTIAFVKLIDISSWKQSSVAEVKIENIA